MHTRANDNCHTPEPERTGPRRRAAAAGAGPSLSSWYVQLNYKEGVEGLNILLDSAKRWLGDLEPPAREEAYKLLVNAYWFIQEHGFDHLGFLTLTLRENVVDAKDAQKRANSFQTNILQKRYGHRYLRVFERQARGAVHYHYLVALAQDLSAGFDWAAQQEVQRVGTGRATRLPGVAAGLPAAGSECHAVFAGRVGLFPQAVRSA